LAGSVAQLERTQSGPDASAAGWKPTSTSLKKKMGSNTQLRKPAGKLLDACSARLFKKKKVGNPSRCWPIRLEGEAIGGGTDGKKFSRPQAKPHKQKILGGSVR